MRIHALLPLALLASMAAPAFSDDSGKEKLEVKSKGWVVPPGEEQRFAQDERECLGPAMGAKGRRADPRRWEACMEGRGWRRK